MSEPIRAIIAGGGTGGHVFPMIAVADALRHKAPGSEVLFVGTADRIESRLVPEAGYELKTIPAGGLKGKGLMSRLGALAKIPLALVRSAFIISRFGPHVVLGGGGYASWPLCRSAAFQGVPLALLEVNSLPGLATRKLSGKAVECYTAFKSTEKHLACPSVLTGNPIRAEVRCQPPEAGHGEMRLLIIGGSQGAVGLNSLVIEALPLIRQSSRDFYITHQTGERDHERVEKAYRQNGIRGQVISFIDDMATAYRNADCVIARAGATTVAELIAARRPAVLVPLPTAADNHQEFNANEIVSAGGGVMLRQEAGAGTALVGILRDWYDRRDVLGDMGAKLEQIDHPDAAGDVAERLIHLAERNKPQIG